MPLIRQIPQRLNDFRDHLNELFSDEAGPFVPAHGMVAGTRQYKHASYAIFEGYAGTSASGLADEVEADKATAKLDYVEDLYHYWNEGGQPAGGATPRIEAEFDRIRAELGDLPGTAASPERLRTMLRHLTRTLHPGVLNDCFHQPATTV
ncbi:hypothetical protein ACIQM3_31915 [Streptomyces sp. NPDC091271]|uniref:hypothetical protein n=1 Tax=Streptomyces sp. NPDC091271 TaxID=3365980 RepID=UPI00380EAADC